MRTAIVEDRGVLSLEPLTLTRAAFELWCGAATLLQRHRRAVPQGEVGLVVRPELAELTRLDHPELPVNDAAWLGDVSVVVNARWLPPAEPLADLGTPHVGLCGGEV